VREHGGCDGSLEHKVKVGHDGAGRRDALHESYIGQCCISGAPAGAQREASSTSTRTHTPELGQQSRSIAVVHISKSQVCAAQTVHTQHTCRPCDSPWLARSCQKGSCTADFRVARVRTSTCRHPKIKYHTPSCTYAQQPAGNPVRCAG
jgi:hypothetical protein